MTLAAALLLSSAVSAELGAPRHHHRPHKSSSASSLRHKLAGVRQRKNHLRAELRATKRQAHAVKLDIRAVDEKLVTAKVRLDQTRDRLSGARQEQGLVARQLVAANKELAQTRKLVRVRLRRIYMEGQTSSISVLAGTRSAGDVASRGFLLTAIEHKDHDLFTHYTQLQRSIADHKRRQDELVKEVEGLVVEERDRTQDLADTRQEKSDALDQLREKQGALEDMIRQFEEDEASIANQIEAYEREAARRRVTRGEPELPAFTGRFSRPVNARITSTFGMRYHPILHRTRMHTGIDFGASFGSPIHAAASGVVIATAWMRGYGNVVMIDHGGGYSTVYAHTSRILCSQGQHVERGQVIAAVGATGLATGPHLHFEVRFHGRPVDPFSRL